MNESIAEYVAPPAYYVNFSQSSSSIPNPPSIPSLLAFKDGKCEKHISTMIYGGTINIESIEQQNYSRSKDYKSEFLRCASNLNRQVLSIASDVPSRTPTHIPMGELQATVDEFFSICKEYRVHEAREMAIMQLQSELQELTDLEDKFKSVLDKYNDL